MNGDLDALTILNTLLVVATFGALAVLASIHRLAATGPHFPPDAYRWVLLPLTLTAFVWSIEYVLLTTVTWIVGRHPPWYVATDTILNLIVCVGFFFTGWNLFRLEGRIHFKLPPDNPPRPFMRFVRDTLGSKAAALAFAATGVGILCFSLPRAERPASLDSYLQGAFNCAGMLVFAFGLYYQLTREKPDPVSRVIATSLVLYAFAQLPQPQPGTFLYELTWGVVAAAKVAVLVGVAFFWVMISERNLAEQRQTQKIAAEISRRSALRVELHQGALQDIGRASAALKKALGVPIHANDSRFPPLLLTACDAVRDADARIRQIMNRDLAEDLYPEGFTTHVAIALRGLKCRQPGIRIDTSYSLLRSLPQETEGALTLVALEAISNVEKHSQADHLTIRLSTSESEAALRVTDDGIGFDHKQRIPGDHFGLIAMRRAVTRLGGDLSVEPAKGRGTKVVVRIELDD